MNWRSFLTILVLFPLIDYVWLGVVMSGFYVEMMGPQARIKGDKIEIVPWAAVLVYVLLTAGITVFVLPLVADGPWWRVFMMGALFGLVCYGVYDGSNHGTLKQWPVALMLADIGWGALASGLVTLAGWKVAEIFG